jgi:hypothetical protein
MVEKHELRIPASKEVLQGFPVKPEAIVCQRRAARGIGRCQRILSQAHQRC